MQVVVADMAPRGGLKTAFGQRAAIEGNHIGQARVGHRHVRAQLGDGGVGATTASSISMLTLSGTAWRKNRLAFAIDLGTRDPRRIIAAARKLQYPPQVIQFFSRLGFIIAVELHVDADLGLFVERRQRRKRRRLLALAA